MNVAAFVLLAGTLAGFVILDGYDLGMGAIHLFYARTQEERAASFRAIGPFWSGNEVLLIAAGAILFALFPKVYAVSFSGFYLPFMVLLWLLMVRGVSIELRGHLKSALWYGFWDVAFSVSSILLALILGVALGNVLRGVPLQAQGYFAGSFSLLLNGYALLVGVFALIALAMHGSAFAIWRVGDELRMRAQKAFPSLWVLTLILLIIVTVLTLRLRAVSVSPALLLAPAAALISLVMARFLPRADLRFSCTTVFLFAVMACAAQTLYPYLLPAFPLGTGGLTIFNSAPAGASISTAFTAGVIGIGAALVYATLAARRILKNAASDVPLN